LYLDPTSDLEAYLDPDPALHFRFGSGWHVFLDAGFQDEWGFMRIQTGNSALLVETATTISKKLYRNMFIKKELRDNQCCGSGSWIECFFQGCGSGSGIRCFFDPWIRDPE
jgi:hypothetical protein